ncbi:MAG: AEC family transporter [Lachnospiraceae bacterium]|nr:AEC family transporter [Lachnospiraceae bacterium]
MSINIGKLFSSPFVLSFGVGLLLFFTQIPLPAVIKDVINASAGLNTPIAMMVSGVYLAKADIKSMLHTKALFQVSFVRLILIPIFSAGLLSLLPSGFYEVKMCLLLASICPFGTNVAVYAQLHGKNYCYAAQTVVISTLLSVLTIPLFVMAVQGIWNM